MAFLTLGILAVTAFAGAYSAYKKGEISKEEYERLTKLGDEMGAKLKAPPGTAQPFTPEEYAYAQRYSPQLATYVEQKQPEIVKEAGSQRELGLQQKTLSEYANRATTGKDVIADAQREEALFEADARDKSRRSSILRDMANRGLSGSGQDLLSQQQASQDAAVAARQASLDAVKQGEARRLQALGDMAGLASNVRNQNYQVEQNNAAVMNAYNQRLADSRNLYNQNAAATQNQAQQFNIVNKMAVDNANTGVRNQANYGNLIRNEEAKQRLLDFENAKATGQYDRAAALSKQQAAIQQEQFKDYVQAGTGAFSAVASAHSAGQQAAANERAAAQKDRELDIKDQEVQNNTNRSRSLYN